ncbi:TetR/AcrR family transcriptional regulator [Eggerthella guodeyinii]|uniref:TetR family transcriptional regulator n=1 Tax=Eggerthella guodeyinii TaxID=2690837 RepID=A0A6N7RK22_9ACTN|nr:TetR-like C-terminal domain-containing protein [Eggerthella guodeyinii]MRX81311.1 TetR family transcriptional regulator [Eggerthella guodeyinii]
MMQNNIKDDPRITRSKNMLRKALIDLLDNQSVDNISVKDLVEQAQIARSTFYLYYLDKQDFLDKTINETLAVYEQKVQGFDELPYRAAIQKRGEAFFNYIAENADFYRVMLGDNGVAAFRNRMANVGYRYFYARYEPLALKDASKDDLATRSIKFSILANYIVEGKISVTSRWLDSGMDLSPNYLARITSDIVYGVLVERKLLSPTNE